MTRDDTTTHAGYGEGNPVLVLAMGEHDWSGQPQPVFPLRRQRTTIGSAPDADVRLDGLAPVHAEVRHDDRDDYVLTLLAPGLAPMSTGDTPTDLPAPQVLHTGATVRLGSWALTFQRAEAADHGRPAGGRSGGEGERGAGQPPRPDYRADHEDAARREGDGR